MAKNKKYEPTNPNKRKDKKPVITCPHCGSTNMEYVPDRRRIPSKWYIHVAAAVAVVVLHACFLSSLCFDLSVLHPVP